MGTWGAGTFENDDARDWVAELQSTPDWALVHQTLRGVADATGYLEAPDCSVGLAACEVVAASAGRLASDLPPEVRAWVDTHGRHLPVNLLPLGLRVLDRVIADSELRELWEQAGEVDVWLAWVQALRQRLTG